MNIIKNFLTLPGSRVSSFAEQNLTKLKKVEQSERKLNKVQHSWQLFLTKLTIVFNKVDKMLKDIEKIWEKVGKIKKSLTKLNKV